MKAATHIAFAGVVGVTAAGFGASPGLVGAGALCLGSLLPDIDTAHSGLGRWVRPVSRVLERRFGHRTLTHSLLGTLLTACALSWLLLLNPAALVWLLVGYVSHVLLDTANISGVPLLWPWRLQFWLVGNRAWRVPYGSPHLVRGVLRAGRGLNASECGRPQPLVSPALPDALQVRVGLLALAG